MWVGHFGEVNAKSLILGLACLGSPSSGGTQLDTAQALHCLLRLLPPPGPSFTPILSLISCSLGAMMAAEDMRPFFLLQFCLSGFIANFKRFERKSKITLFDFVF